MAVDLYPFQKADNDKIEPQRVGLIGSEMGTGKTYQGIDLEMRWYEDGKSKGRKKPSLIVAPINTWDGWVDKYQQQSPQTDVVVIDRKNRAKFINDARLHRGDVFLMHWEALRLMPELQGIEFETIIADEVHRASGHKTAQTRALKKLKAYHKLGMSGTASGDNPIGLWSPLHWLKPRDPNFRSYWKFYDTYAKYEIQYPQGYRKITGVKNVEQLHSIIDPYYVRHLKRTMCCDDHPNGVMSWLPDKAYEKIWVDLLPEQRRVYEQMRADMLAWVGEHEESPLSASIAVVQMLRLSQMALGMPTIEDGRVRLSEPSSKLDAAQALFKDHPDKKFVVFSSSKQILYVAEKKFKEAGIGSVFLSGDTPQSERRGMVKRFQESMVGDCQLFLAVIDAAGEGIDGLQYATDTMVFLDRHWSALKNKQAEDRLDRGGQEGDATLIYDIMARDTVDLGKEQKLVAKWEWIKSILGDGL